MIDKIDQLARLKQKCQDLVAQVYPLQNKVVVFGEGNANARIVLVGEAPGAEETVQQRPFVGKAGKNLDVFLNRLSLQRDDIYITNVVKFRPVKANDASGRLSNRPPTREEIALFCPLLQKELEIIRPQVVVTLGNVPLQAFTDKKTVIGSVHGGAHASLPRALPYVLFPLYHPASIIYNRALAETYAQDLDNLAVFLETLS